MYKLTVSSKIRSLKQRKYDKILIKTEKLKTIFSSLHEFKHIREYFNY